MRSIFPTMLCVFLLSTAVHAQTMYINNDIKITLRTGPGTDHKVIRMLKSGQELEVMEHGEDWTHVRLPGGVEGWLLTRFISPAKPADLLLRILEVKYERLLEKSNTLSEENKTLKEENARLSGELQNANGQLSEVSTSFKSLKEGASEYLNLKEEYEKTATQLTEQTNRAQALNELLLKRNITLGLAGAGVLFFGFIVGYSTKKQRKRSSLLS